MVLPLVLAGPVLRRCSSRSAFVWIAFSEDVTAPDPVSKDSRSLEFEIYSNKVLMSLLSLSDDERSANAIGGNYKPKRNQVGKIETPSVHRGTIKAHLNPLDHLHIFLIEATPFDKDFPPGEILGYEVYLVEQAAQADAAGKIARFRYGISDHLHGASTPSTSLEKKGTPLYQRGYSDDPGRAAQGRATGTVADSSQAYPKEWRPVHLIRDWATNAGKWCFPVGTFVLQKNGESTRAWMGSCFKLHGQPLSASLLMYDGSAKTADGGGVLYDSARSPELRPHMLVLMGDQIYADDVAFVVADGVARLRDSLVGGVNEMLPGPMNLGIRDFDWNQRRKFVGVPSQPKEGEVEYSPFRLETGVENQVFTFSEYAALYLYHLNPALWLDPHAQSLSLSTKDKAHWKKRIQLERVRLSKNRVAVLHYATVKANMPTFMLCDDHEVTDDWFFDREWIEAVVPMVGKPTKATHGPSIVGQYVVANAMYAYYAFQALGNGPAVQILPKDLIRPDSIGFEANLQVLLAQSWSFIIPVSPPILCLDTRTQRSGTGDALTRPSSGFDRIQLSTRWEGVGGERTRERIDTHHESGLMLLVESSTLDALLSAATHEGNVIIVTPSPVLSSDTLALAKERWGSARDNDAEGWRDNYSNYFLLVDALISAQAKKCTVISGDFHYGYRRSCVVSKKSLTTLLGETTIDQIVSSSILNPFELKFGDGRSWVLEKLAESNFEGDYANSLRYTPSTLGTGNVMHRWRITRDADQLVVGVPPPSYSEALTSVVPNIRVGQGGVKNIVWSSHFVEVVFGATVESHYYVQTRDEDE